MKLTKREHQLIDELMKGLSNKQIAYALNIQEGTVKAMFQNIFRKTGVRTRVGVAVLVLQRKISET